MLDILKYRHNVDLNNEISAYLERLYFEYSGYESLIKEFTINSPGNVEYSLDQEKYKYLLDEYKNSRFMLTEAVCEYLDLNDKSEQIDFFIDFSSKKLFYNVLGD